ncbi:hypothetical protein A28LD_1790 [Idiomarina sp. A28L]|uniref:hypothetical protein n=1 Tax=Idiomarina sp. A28L TaxID=1036674 RepID=UPI0002138676|nr:hypothetical protein [Idiomarina sp. A28L]EGN74774.1 hypothetical protein A28LD_1790 [Idiomarina sp. A28L]
MSIRILMWLIMAFVVFRLLDSITTVYGISIGSDVFELNPFIEANSITHVLLSPVHFWASIIGILAIILFYMIRNNYILAERPNKGWKNRLLYVLIDIFFTLMILTLIAVVNNLVILFLGWDNVLAFRNLFQIHWLLPLGSLFLFAMVIYECFLKKRLQIFCGLDEIRK